MSIKNKLQEIGEYFKNKIIEGDYEFVDCDEYKAGVIIDKDYLLDLWIANESKYNFHVYRSDAIGISFCSFKNQKERLQAYNKLKPLMEKYRENDLRAKKLKQLEQLKEELGVE